MIYSGENLVSSTHGEKTTQSNLKSKTWLESVLGWDFDSDWDIVDGNYPVLKSFK